MDSPRPGRISLLLSDCDGTLVTRDKRLTERTIEAVGKLREAGIIFAITSSRPPAGMATIVETLQITTPIAGFNGGMIVGPSGVVLRTLVLDQAVAARTIEILADYAVDIWVFRGNEWLLTNPDGAYVPRETRTIGYGPHRVESFADRLSGVTKIVASSQDYDRLIRAEQTLHRTLGGSASASLSQPYYLDVTPPAAHKGNALLALSEILRVPTHEVAAIGDGENDTKMFAVAGFSIAMGNAADDVKSHAHVTTASNEEDGFAEAVERYIIPRKTE